MGDRGRQSTAALSVVSAAPGQRVVPPVGMLAAQKKVWCGVVSSRPADWFDTGSLGLLIEYCRHMVRADELERQIRKMMRVAAVDDDDVMHQYEKILTMAHKETNAIAALATKMRLTQQSRYDDKTANTAARKSKADRPWAASR